MDTEFCSAPWKLLLWSSRHNIDLVFDEENMKPERLTEALENTGIASSTMRVSWLRVPLSYLPCSKPSHRNAVFFHTLLPRSSSCSPHPRLGTSRPPGLSFVMVFKVSAHDGVIHLPRDGPYIDDLSSDAPCSPCTLAILLVLLVSFKFGLRLCTLHAARATSSIFRAYACPYHASLQHAFSAHALSCCFSATPVNASDFFFDVNLNSSKAFSENFYCTSATTASRCAVRFLDPAACFERFPLVSACAPQRPVQDRRLELDCCTACLHTIIPPLVAFSSSAKAATLASWSLATCALAALDSIHSETNYADNSSFCVSGCFNASSSFSL